MKITKFRIKHAMRSISLNKPVTIVWALEWFDKRFTFDGE